MTIKTCKVLKKGSLSTKPKLRRSSRKNAGKRSLTYFEEYASDIMAVYMDGEDTEEVLKALKEEDIAAAKAMPNEDADYEDDQSSDFESDSEEELDNNEKDESIALRG
jgi:hypothetical protein|tara:strand:- start:2360 stop:2683 length:324 start_codon:yes stop_codon:yes gene_type:complete